MVAPGSVGSRLGAVFPFLLVLVDLQYEGKIFVGFGFLIIICSLTPKSEKNLYSDNIETNNLTLEPASEVRELEFEGLDHFNMGHMF